jgi:Zn-dependent peptidase ImmA (M78 family)
MEATTNSDPRPVNPDMLILARESRGLPQTALAERAGISQGRLSKMEAGLLPAPPDVLEKVAGVLGYPEEFFRQTDAVYGPSTSEFFHRKRQSTAIKVIDQLHALLNIRRMHVARFLRAVDFSGRMRMEHVDLDEYDSPEEVARKIRADWRLPSGPVRDVVRTIEQAGGVIVRFSFGTPKVDAVSTWVPGLPPLFFINREMPADRERLSLAHELGHILMHSTVRPDMESEANKFAAEFLMPAADIRPHLHDLNLSRLAGLKPFWRVSMQALLMRATDLATIAKSRAQSLWVQLSQQGYRKREPAELDFPHEVPRALQELVEIHHQRLGYSSKDLARLLALTETEAENYYGPRDSKSQRKGLALV